MTRSWRSSTFRWMREHILHIGLFALTCVLYGRSVGFEFVTSWDDDIYVINNPLIRQLSWTNLRTMFSEIYFGFYSPLHHLSYAFDYVLWGEGPAGFHATNVVLHGTSAVLVCLVVARLTGRKGLAWVVALLFAVHPINVENVAWVSERKSMLSMAFFCLTLLAYLHYRRLPSRRAYVAVIALYALALLSKPIVVTLPLLLGAWELFLAPQPRRWMPIVPLFAMALALAGVSLVAQAGEGVTNSQLSSPAFLFGTVYPTVVPVFWEYARLLVFPVGLCGFYDTTIYDTWLAWPVLLSLAAWVALFFAVFRRGTPRVKFWFCWFWICLLPVSNIIPSSVFFADRYMYAPAIGVFVLFAVSANALAELLAKRWSLRGDTLQRRMRVGFALIVLLLMWGTHERLDVWRDELSFWRDTAAKSPRIYSARLNLGVAYQRRGQLPEAEAEYAAALQILDTPEARDNLRMIRVMRQNLERR